MKKGYVYKITNPKGRIYVGSTTNLRMRKYSYNTNNCKYQTRLLNSLKKYGFKQHLFEILWEGQSSEMLQREREFGLKLKVLDRKTGLNCKLPACGEKYNSFSIGTLLKMKKARLGESAYWNNEPVSIYDIDGKYIKSFNSIKECALELNCSYRMVGRTCNGGTIRKKLQVRKGKNIGEIGKVVYKARKKRLLGWGRKIKCINDDRIFPSIMQASKFYNISITAISNILAGRSKTSRDGKIFCYI